MDRKNVTYGFPGTNRGGRGGRAANSARAKAKKEKKNPKKNNQTTKKKKCMHTLNRASTVLVCALFCMLSCESIVSLKNRSWPYLIRID